VESSDPDPDPLPEPEVVVSSDPEPDIPDPELSGSPEPEPLVPEPLVPDEVPSSLGTRVVATLSSEPPPGPELSTVPLVSRVMESSEPL
jgi:hypothetical protein